MQSGLSQGLGFMAQVGKGAWHCTSRVGWTRVLWVQLLVLWSNPWSSIFHLTLLCLLFLPSPVSLEILRSLPSSLPSLSSSTSLAALGSQVHFTLRATEPQEEVAWQSRNGLGPILALLLFMHGSTHGPSPNRSGQKHSLQATVTATLLVSFPWWFGLYLFVITLPTLPKHWPGSSWLASYLLGRLAGLQMANKCFGYLGNYTWGTKRQGQGSRSRLGSLGLGSCSVSSPRPLEPWVWEWEGQDPCSSLTVGKQVPGSPHSALEKGQAFWLGSVWHHVSPLVSE